MIVAFPFMTIKAANQIRPIKHRLFLILTKPLAAFPQFVIICQQSELAG